MIGEAREIARMLSESNKVVAFTGAGISTESGIADFRSPGGIWSKYSPVYYQDFLTSDDARRQYWLMKKEGYWEMRNAKPNEGHRVLAELEEAGILVGVITQNIDGLHTDAGSRRVLELHGTSRHCICIQCSEHYSPDLIQERLEGGIEIPLCDCCGGFIKVGTVSFGQSLPPDVLEEAFELATDADLCLAIGSSLVVEPAASIPLQTKRESGRLIIINRDETPLDPIADIVIHQSIGETLSQAAIHLGLRSPQ